MEKSKKIKTKYITHYWPSFYSKRKIGFFGLHGRAKFHAKSTDVFFNLKNDPTIKIHAKTTDVFLT
jgi:hypothetical protein